MSNIEKAMAHLRVIYAYTAFAHKRDTCFLGLKAICDIEERASDALDLLKEQKAIKRTSRKGTNGFIIVWTCGACGSDLHPNNAKAKYCSNCGQAVKWE